jgi:hypothetical protein
MIRNLVDSSYLAILFFSFFLLSILVILRDKFEEKRKLGHGKRKRTNILIKIPNLSDMSIIFKTCRLLEGQFYNFGHGNFSMCIIFNMTCAGYLLTACIN